MFKKIKKNKALIILGVIIFVALCVRLWNIQELFVFKMDQARDISLVQEAYDNGIGELPLLGPRAAKTYLRLGPIFYYFEYVSMWITGNKSPMTVVWPDFIFSILTIPLFYYFLRQAFCQKVSLMTTAVFASSFFLVQYSRFAWNPNSIPFWSLLFLLGMYKVIIATYDKNKKIKKGIKKGSIRPFSGVRILRKITSSSKESFFRHQSGGWLLLAMTGYIMASQLHFTAMLAYPLIAVVFGLFFYKLKWWKNISWKYWVGAAAILAVFYLPMILSEKYTEGDNWEQFKYALSGREKEEFSLKLKMIQSLRLHSEYFYYSLSSFGKGEDNIFIIGYLMAIGGAALIVMKQFKNFGTRDGKQKKIFFVLILIWFGVIGGLYTKLAFNVLKPRYWLLNMPIVFIVLAIWFDYGINWTREKKHKNILFGIIVAMAGMLVFVNLYAVGCWYWSVQNQQDVKIFNWKLKLKDNNKIPYGQLKKAAEYINTDIRRKAEKDNKEICFYTTGEYRPVYDYIFENYYLNLKIDRLSFGSDTNENCLFIAIDHNQHREIPRIPKDHKDEFEKVINGKKEIGFITIWEVVRIKQGEQGVEEIIITDEDNESKLVEVIIEKKVENENIVKEGEKSSIELKKIVNELTENTQEGEIDIVKVNEESVDVLVIEQEKTKKPRRKERIRWKHVFGAEVE